MTPYIMQNLVYEESVFQFSKNLTKIGSNLRKFEEKKTLGNFGQSFTQSRAD